MNYKKGVIAGLLSASLILPCGIEAQAQKYDVNTSYQSRHTNLDSELFVEMMDKYLGPHDNNKELLLEIALSRPDYMTDEHIYKEIKILKKIVDIADMPPKAQQEYDSFINKIKQVRKYQKINKKHYEKSIEKAKQFENLENRNKAISKANYVKLMQDKFSIDAIYGLFIAGQNVVFAKPYIEALRQDDYQRISMLAKLGMSFTEFRHSNYKPVEAATTLFLKDEISKKTYKTVISYTQDKRTLLNAYFYLAEKVIPKTSSYLKEKRATQAIQIIRNKLDGRKFLYNNYSKER